MNEIEPDEPIIVIDDDGEIDLSVLSPEETERFYRLLEIITPQG